MNFSVVVDRQSNEKANTGGFELLYVQKTFSTFNSGQLEVAGTHLTHEYFSEQPMTSEKNLVNINPMKKKIEPVTYIRELGLGMRNTLENLLKVLKQEKSRRLGRKSISIETIFSNTSNHTQTSSLLTETIKE
ncbi:hypothetical protein JTB14_021418 [Gonioctena quinquepunctata]|nr:hypothetical protein JTB14_021418 [Gonioctena quinquepunctata]